ncbi:LPS export ABC transporter periplasmic protein LptC [Vogesella indigofera]|uniref:LPS export ABC transporter periplasmic protein LptC n=1 Tax=Vogesella indigofera TaxID=45465 RepID=UPI00234ED158|nr:LPS export ABC transporter periplasmic protein LptC [Vogesella indigofera]MDC7708804.1 LPS export ABC transporter periplasmic protein LptC [Vogesella indigofera]
MNRAARLFPLGLMLGMALLAFWLNVLTMQRGDAPGKIDLSRPEYTINQLTAKRFDAQGRPQQYLQAAQMWQLPRNPNVYLSKPRIEVFLQGIPDYTVTAATGRYHKQQKTADFSDNVRWERKATADAPAILLQTSVLHVDTVARSASNRAPLVADYGTSQLKSTGFIYQQDSGQLNLLSNVRITYAP